ncbi:MAG: hypothetical protein WAK02_06830 [Terriglobales bacterium]
MLNRANTVRVALTLALFAIVLALSLSADFYSSSMVDAFMAMALSGAVVILLVVQPSWINLAAVAVGSLILAGLDYRLLGFPPKLMAAFSFAGLSAWPCWARAPSGRRNCSPTKTTIARSFYMPSCPRFYL